MEKNMQKIKTFIRKTGNAFTVILCLTLISTLFCVSGCQNLSYEKPEIEVPEIEIPQISESTLDAFKKAGELTAENQGTEPEEDNQNEEDKPNGEDALTEQAKIEFTWDVSGVTIFEDPMSGEFQNADNCDLDIILTLYGEEAKGGYSEENEDEKSYYDASGNLLMKSEIKQDGNIKKYTCTVYSFDENFDIQAVPVTLVNGIAGYPINAVITQNGKDAINLTGGDMARRSYTGIWFFGICTYENGNLGQWTVPEYMESGNEAVE